MGSRFVGTCEIVTNGERVWVTGIRVPVWVMLARVCSYIAFLPVGFATGVLLGETLLGHRGYPPYYYLLSLLMTFLLVVLGMWGAGIWNRSLGSYDTVSWPAPKGRSLLQARAKESDSRRALWPVMNKFYSTSGQIQVEIPIGPGGKPRRLVLRTQDTGAYSVISVLSGAYYGQTSRDAVEAMRSADPWRWSRN
jgi:hypothetical protein